LDTETKNVIDQLGSDYRAAISSTTKQSTQIDKLRARLDVMAFGAGAFSATTCTKFWLPSHGEYKAQSIGSDLCDRVNVLASNTNCSLVIATLVESMGTPGRRIRRAQGAFRVLRHGAIDSRSVTPV